MNVYDAVVAPTAHKSYIKTVVKIKVHVSEKKGGKIFNNNNLRLHIGI